MVVKIYPYLGEQNIGVEAPENILDRVEGNIDENAIDERVYDGIVRAWEGELRTIERDKTAKYISTRKNTEREIEGCDYLRYRTHVQTIWRRNDFEYEVQNHLSNDETGVLKCFKKVYYMLPKSQDKTLLHATAVDVAGKGILFIGKKRAGKTSLAFSMIDRLGASLVEGGNSLVSFNNGLRVYYLPRPIFARFVTIAESAYLNILLEDIEKTEAQQPWDIEAIHEIIRTRAFCVDGGLNFSRRAFGRLSGKRALSTSMVKTIVFPSYSGGGVVKVNSISIEEAYKRLVEREYKRDTALGKVQDQDHLEHPQESIVRIEWLERL